MISFAGHRRRRPRTQQAVLACFRAQERLTDALLCWWMKQAGLNPGAAKSARYQLVRRGALRFYGWHLEGEKRPVKIWEYVRPRYHQPQHTEGTT